MTLSARRLPQVYYRWNAQTSPSPRASDRPTLKSKVYYGLRLGALNTEGMCGINSARDVQLEWAWACSQKYGLNRRLLQVKSIRLGIAFSLVVYLPAYALLRIAIPPWCNLSGETTETQRAVGRTKRGVRLQLREPGAVTTRSINKPSHAYSVALPFHQGHRLGGFCIMNCTSGSWVCLQPCCISDHPCHITNCPHWKDALKITLRGQ